MGVLQLVLGFGVYLTLIMDTKLAVMAEEQTADETLQSTEAFDDRININRNYAIAHAKGKHGSESGSQANSYGYQAGLLYSNGHYQPIASQTGSNANSFTSGRKPPLTYANTGSVVGHQGIKGHAGAGFSGGQGNALAGSQSQQIVIPLGFGGPVLLSNLKPLKNHTGSINNDNGKTNEIELPSKIKVNTTHNPSVPSESEKFVFN